MAKKKQKRKPARGYTAREILDLWTKTATTGLGTGKKFHSDIPRAMNAKLLAKIQSKLDNNEDFGKDKAKTKVVANDIGKVCRMLTLGATVSLDTFQLVFEFLKDNHPACPTDGGAGGWCDV